MKIVMRSNVRNRVGLSSTRPRYLKSNKKSRSQTDSAPLKKRRLAGAWRASGISIQACGCVRFHRLYYREALVGEEIRGPLRRTENQGSGYCIRRPDNQNTLTKIVLGKIKTESRIFPNR